MPRATPASVLVRHPDNLLGFGQLPPALETQLLAEGVRFATQLKTASGQPFLLCGRRCPSAAAADMLRDALRVRQSR